MIQSDNQKQYQTCLEDIQTKITKLLIEVQDKLQAAALDLTKDIQEELAKQIALLQRFGEYVSGIQNSRRKRMSECATLESKLVSAQLALRFLLMNKTENIVLAQNLRYDIEYFINSKKPLGSGFIYNFFKRAIREFSAPNKVLLGLAIALPIYPIAISISFPLVGSVTKIADADLPSLSTETLTPQPTPSSNSDKNGVTAHNHKVLDTYSLIVFVALSGAFGSIISILFRIQQYKDSEYTGAATPILVGFAKPLIGTAFGLFVFAVINSGITNIIGLPSIQSPTLNKGEHQDNEIYYLYFSIAFIVGFSERLANDIVERAEANWGIGKDVEESSKIVHEASTTATTKVSKVKEGIENSEVTTTHHEQATSSPSPLNNAIEAADLGQGQQGEHEQASSKVGSFSSNGTETQANEVGS